MLPTEGRYRPSYRTVVQMELSAFLREGVSTAHIQIQFSSRVLIGTSGIAHEPSLVLVHSSHSCCFVDKTFQNIPEFEPQFSNDSRRVSVRV